MSDVDSRELAVERLEKSEGAFVVVVDNGDSTSIFANGSLKDLALFVAMIQSRLTQSLMETQEGVNAGRN